MFYSHPLSTSTCSLRIRLIRASLLLLCSLCLAGSLRAQDEKVILTTREVNVKQALDEIARQTDYRLSVNWENLDANQRVLLSGNLLSVKDLLVQVLASANYDYQLRENHIVIAPRRVEEQQGMLQHRPQRPFQSAMANHPSHYSQLVEVPDPWNPRPTSHGNIAQTSSSGYWRTASAQDGESTEIVMLHFRVGKSNLERDFMGNARSLEIIDRTFSDYALVSEMEYITITAGSSPEGNTNLNERLARDRALAIKSYLMSRHPYLNRDRIITYSVGEDWSGLQKLIEDDPYVPSRYTVLSLLNTPYYNTDQKKTQLKQIAGGQAYRYIADNMLPYLRGGAACMIYFKKEAEPVDAPVVAAEPAPTVVPERDTVYIDNYIDRERTVELYYPREKTSGSGYLALKTNLLYDAALLPNVGIEFPLAPSWSMEIDGNVAWWAQKSKQKYYRVGFGGVEVRRWFGWESQKAPLNGHFFGLYAMGGHYDLKFGDKGYQSDFSYSVGLTYGYAMPIGRRLNLEFSLGVGYLGGKYKKFTYSDVDDCYPWIENRDRHYFGPTKAKVSLVWLIGGGRNWD